MTTFDERDKGFENKFAHDEELTFKIHARRNKLLGLWAAACLGKKGADAEQYAKEILLADFVSHSDVVNKLLKDFMNAGIKMNDNEIHAEMERLMPIATKQVMGE